MSDPLAHTVAELPVTSAEIETPASKTQRSPEGPVHVAQGVRALSDAHRRHLHTSGLTDSIIEERGYVTVTKAGVHYLEKRFGAGQCRSGIMYPQFELGRQDAHHWELRPDQPRERNSKPVKYERPTGVEQIPDVLPRFRSQLDDPSIDIWITEGVKKADSLTTLGLLSINLPGVYGFRTSKRGAAMTHPGLRDEIPWEGRRVVIAFDADRATNRQVHVAVRRLVNLLASWGARVDLLHFPQDSEDKTGVDDFLVRIPMEQRLASLEALAQPYIDGVVPGETLGLHPETKLKIRNPPGYTGGHAGRISYSDPRSGNAHVIYTGDLVVDATGCTPDGVEHLNVRFRVGRERVRTVVAPRTDLVRRGGVLDHLGGAGANVHEGNAAAVARYLGEFSALNADALPRRVLTDRLGATENGIITPQWCVGEPATYIGKAMPWRIKSNPEAYVQAIREIAEWSGEVWVPRALLGFVAASPLLDTLGVDRNPVVAIGGESNIGKTTLARFSMAMYALPSPPMMISGVRTRITALLQSFKQLNGLPAWIDEAHQLEESTLTEVVYAFANQQSYARGGRDGDALGGDTLRGFLLLTGEGLADLRTTGARNRSLVVDGSRHLPLGSRQASKHVKLLNDAVAEGAGSVGERVVAHLWAHRVAWRREVFELGSMLDDDSHSWHLPAAAAEVTLRYVRDAVALAPDAAATGLAQMILTALRDGWAAVDPAQEAFERLRDLVVAARADGNVRYARDGSVLARMMTRSAGNRVWAVRASAPEVEDITHQFGGARVVAPVWVARGLTSSDSTGRTQVPMRLVPGETPIRCYVFQRDAFESDNRFDAEHDETIS